MSSTVGEKGGVGKAVGGRGGGGAEAVTAEAVLGTAALDSDGVMEAVVETEADEEADC